MTCAFLGCSLLQHRAIVAECGDYVIIGNKEKLAELKAAGYKVESEMDSHGMSLKDGPPVKIPMPCSGPQCKSNQAPTPVPAGVPISISVFKSGINGTGKQPFKGDSQFHGYQNHDEKPTSYQLLLDRPPE